MIKQRDLFDPKRVDILSDSGKLNEREIVQLHNAGYKVVIPGRQQKRQEQRPEQSKLF